MRKASVQMTAEIRAWLVQMDSLLVNLEDESSASPPTHTQGALGIDESSHDTRADRDVNTDKYDHWSYKALHIAWLCLWIILSVTPAALRLSGNWPNKQCDLPSAHTSQPYLGIFFVASGFVSLMFAATRAVREKITAKLIELEQNPEAAAAAAASAPGIVRRAAQALRLDSPLDRHAEYM